MQESLFPEENSITVQRFIFVVKKVINLVHLHREKNVMSSSSSVQFSCYGVNADRSIILLNILLKFTNFFSQIRNEKYDYDSGCIIGQKSDWIGSFRIS